MLAVETSADAGIAHSLITILILTQRIHRSLVLSNFDVIRPIVAVSLRTSAFAAGCFLFNVEDFLVVILI